MKQAMKFLKNNRSLITLVACGACVFGVIRATETAQIHFDELTIEGIDTVGRKQQGKAGFENLPLLFAQAAASSKAKPAALESPVDIDAAFLPPATEKKLDNEKVLPDYFKLLPQAIVVGGVSNGGAFIGGDYVSYGSKLDAYSYPAPDGKTVSPILAGRSGKFLIIKEPGANGRTERVSF